MSDKRKEQNDNILVELYKQMTSYHIRLINLLYQMIYAGGFLLAVLFWLYIRYRFDQAPHGSVVFVLVTPAFIIWLVYFEYIYFRLSLLEGCLGHIERRLDVLDIKEAFFNATLNELTGAPWVKHLLGWTIVVCISSLMSVVVARAFLYIKETRGPLLAVAYLVVALGFASILTFAFLSTVRKHRAKCDRPA